MFPTSVGMNRELLTIEDCERCVPHERGDEPELLDGTWKTEECSPRAWG